MNKIEIQSEKLWCVKMGKKKVQVKEFILMLKDVVIKLIKKVKKLEDLMEEFDARLSDLEDRVSKIENKIKELEKAKMPIKAAIQERKSTLLEELEKLGIPPLETPEKEELSLPPPGSPVNVLPEAKEILGEISLEGIKEEKQNVKTPTATTSATHPSTSPAMLPTGGLKEATREEILKDKDELIKALEDLDVI